MKNSIVIAMSHISVFVVMLLVWAALCLALASTALAKDTRRPATAEQLAAAVPLSVMGIAPTVPPRTVLSRESGLERARRITIEEVNAYCIERDASRIKLHGTGRGVMTSGPVKVYTMFYGSFSAEDRDFLNNFVSYMSEHPWFNSATSSVHNSDGECASDTVVLQDTAYHNIGGYVAVTSVSVVWDIISAFITAQGWPLDQEAVYALHIGLDVMYSIDSSSCGWHTAARGYGGEVYPFALLHNHPLSSCTVQDTFPYDAPISVFAQSLASILFHEIIEEMSDTDLDNGLFQRVDPAENADVCAWCFSTDEVLFASNDAAYNVEIGPSSTKYLIQMNYDFRNNSCVGSTPKEPISCSLRYPGESSSGSSVSVVTIVVPIVIVIVVLVGLAAWGAMYAKQQRAKRKVVPVSKL
jgi:hypothetical protein